MDFDTFLGYTIIRLMVPVRVCKESLCMYFNIWPLGDTQSSLFLTHVCVRSRFQRTVGASMQ